MSGGAIHSRTKRLNCGLRVSFIDIAYLPLRKYPAMQEHVILDSEAPVSSLMWSPPGQELYLMAITAGSKLHFWRHGVVGGPVTCPLSIRDWQLDHVEQLSSSPGRHNSVPYTYLMTSARHTCQCVNNRAPVWNTCTFASGPMLW